VGNRPGILGASRLTAHEALPWVERRAAHALEGQQAVEEPGDDCESGPDG